MLSWSSGKDSAWALHVLQRRYPALEVVGLFSTTNAEYGRVAMHGVREALVRRQAQALGLPLTLIELPNPCSNEAYEEIMGEFVGEVKGRGIKKFAFGDLFLEDIRRYREEKLAPVGIEPIFPLWGSSTPQLAREMIEGGLKAVVSCLDPRPFDAALLQRPEDSLCGRPFDEDFLAALPPHIDPCGENGEFHTFVYDSPMFSKPLDITTGEHVVREGFIFCDLL